MTDRALVEKKLAFIRMSLADLRSARIADIRSDRREERFVEHTLQLAIQAALDVALHILADERWGEPEAYRDVFRILGQRGFVGPELAERLSNMAGFRNVLVHGYQDVDLKIVERSATEGLHDLESFIVAVSRRLG